MKVAYLCLQATREGQASHAHVHEIINGLRKQGVTVELYEPFYAGQEKMPGMIERVFGILLAQFNLMFRIRKYEIVYIRAHYLSIMTAVVCKLMKIPYITEINGPIDDGKDLWPVVKYLKTLLTKFRHFEISRSHGVVVVTPLSQKEIESEYKNVNVVTIPNGANQDLFSPRRRGEFKEVEGPYVVFAGVMAKWQGMERIVDSILSEHWPSSIKAVFVGDGPESDLVKEAARKHRHVFYLGTRPYHQVGAIIAGSMANLVLVGRAGGRGKLGASPLKLFEGMASGVPTIATDLNYIGELVNEHQCGLVVPIDYSNEQLCHAVRYISQHPDKAQEMGRNGRMAIENQHSWEQRAIQTYQFMKEILDKRKRI